jgi:chromosome segregation ATPase
LEKLEPSHTTLRRLKALAQENGLKGFRGLFLDFIECDKDISTSFLDIAVKSKLFSVIVDDLDTAKELLKLNT